MLFRSAADLYGLKPGDIRRAATTLLSGIVVGSLFEDQKVFEVVVWSVPEIRRDLSTIANLPIDTPNGRQVRLGDVASVDVAPSPTVIRREGVFRYVDVAVSVSGGDLTHVARDIDAASKTVAMPLEYRAEVLGDYQGRLAEQARLISGSVAAAIAIFLLLQAAFQSWRLAAVVFLSLPAAIAGGVLAAAALGGGTSLGTILGCVMVMAIATRSGILFVRECQRLKAEGDLDGRALLLHATSERFVPLMATVAATVLAFAPFVLLGDRPGYEVIRPMAVVILGGLVTSTLLLLFILPALYQRFAASPEGDLVAQPMSEQPAFEPTTA